MAKIILEKDETMEQVREAIFKSEIESHKTDDPIFESIMKSLNDEYIKMQEEIFSDIIKHFEKAKNGPFSS